MSGRLRPYKVERVLRTDGITCNFTKHVQFTLTEDNYIDKKCISRACNRDRAKCPEKYSMWFVAYSSSHKNTKINASLKIVMDLFVCLFQMSPDTILIQIRIYEVFPGQFKSLYVHIYFYFFH